MKICISIVDVASQHVFLTNSCEVPQNNFKGLLKDIGSPLNSIPDGTKI